MRTINYKAAICDFSDLVALVGYYRCRDHWALANRVSTLVWRYGSMGVLIYSYDI